MRQTEPKLILSEPPTVDYFAPVGSLYMNVLVKRTGDVCKPKRGVRVTPIEHLFEIESSTGCRMIVSLLVVTTNVAAPDSDAPDEDGTAAHDDLHQQFIKINIRQTIPFCSKPFNAVLDCADPALVLLQIRENQIRCVHFINCVYNIHK